MRGRALRTSGRAAPVALMSLVSLVSLTAAPRSARAQQAPTFADRPDGAVHDADRAVCVLVNPIAMAFGVYGAEADVTLGGFAALAFEGDVVVRGGSAATAVGAGVLLYPTGALHGPYVEPRVAYVRPLDEGIARLDWSADAVGVGATAGWQWTWDYGLSARVGGGAMYFAGGASSGGSGPIAAGPQLVTDVSLGWAF